MKRTLLILLALTLPLRLAGCATSPSVRVTQGPLIDCIQVACSVGAR